MLDGAVELKERSYRKHLGDAKQPGAQLDEETTELHALVCARCGHHITEDEARTKVQGLHEHSQINPSGFIWNFGCFSRAPGCARQGPPSDEYAWFAGMSWQICICKSCAWHLGWHFVGGEGSFFGLILERLVSSS